MPGRDGTGPMGRGSMTGGGFGNCSGRGSAGTGRGMGRGGAGRGMSRMFSGGGGFGFNTPNREYDQGQENSSLIRENEALRTELDTIRKRLDKMEARTGDAR